MSTRPHPQRSPGSRQAELEAPSSGEEITPELALVTPDLADVARQALPDRPWESTPVGPLPSQQPERRRAAARDGRAAAPSGAAPAGRRRVHVPLLVVLALAACVGLVSLLRSPAGPVAPPAPQAARPQVAPPGREAAQPSSAAPSPPARASLLPNGGYVVEPSGSLVVDKAGRTIERFELPLRCGGRPLVVENVPVTARSFRFVTTGRRAVRVQGRVVSPTRIRGVVTHRGGRCAPRHVAFTARLS